MDERKVQFRVGVVVFATLLIAIILVVLFSDVGFGRHKVLYVVLPQAPGTTVDTPVRKSGILVGRVKRVEFVDRGHVKLTLHVKEDVRISRAERCQIKSSLLGNAVVEFVPSGENPELADQFVSTGDTVQGIVISDPLQVFAGLEDELGGTAVALGEAGTEVSKLAARLNRLLSENDVQIGRVLKKTEVAMEGFTEMMASVNAVIGDEQIQTELRRGLADLPELIASAQATMVEAKQTMAGFQQTIDRANTNLENLEGFTGPLGERGEELVAKVEASIENVSALLEQFTQFGQALNSDTGSLGRLMHSPELYENLNRSVRNIERAARQLQPILSDVRVFTDKIARDPGRIGVSGALRRRTGIK